MGTQSHCRLQCLQGLQKHVVSKLWMGYRVRTFTQSLSIRHCTNCCSSPWQELDMLVWTAPETTLVDEARSSLASQPVG